MIGQITDTHDDPVWSFSAKWCEITIPSSRKRTPGLETPRNAIRSYATVSQLLFSVCRFMITRHCDL